MVPPVAGTEVRAARLRRSASRRAWKPVSGVDDEAGEPLLKMARTTKKSTTPPRTMRRMVPMDMELFPSEEVVDGGETGVAGALNPEERALIRAVAGGHSDRSLAKLLGVAPSTVNVRKRTVFEKVKRFLAVRGHRGPERSGGADE